MNTIFKSISLAAAGMLAGVALQSCALDEPFNLEGEGTLQMKLVINSDVTRAENDIDELSSNCVVYISGSKGLLHKYQGLENVPESVNLKAGHYVAEAWTGDSVSASFDKKFFRGYQPFDITSGVTPVVVNCKIANVVVSINPATVDPSLMKDFNVTVGNSRASLDFNSENYDYAKGYFMMPNGETTLNVSLSGTNAEGKAFTKELTLDDVERAHEYVLNFSYNPEFDAEGGSFVTITVDDTEILVESEVEIFGKPRITGVGFDVERQILGNANSFKEQIVKLNAFGSIENLIISSPDYAAMNLPEQTIDLKHCTDLVASSVRSAGLTWDESYNVENNLVTSFMTLTSGFLNALPERNEEYVLTLTITDKYGKTVEQPLRIAVGEGAVVIEDPLIIDEPDYTNDLMAVLSTRATLTGSLVDPEAENPSIRYREAGSQGAWTTVAIDGAAVSANAAPRRRAMSAAQILRAPSTKFSVTLTGLKPDTRYEYQAVAADFVSESKYVTTESAFTIPNASLEEWSNFSENSKVLLPGLGGERTFWDSGNHGSATMSVTLTQGSTDMFHSGSQSARLRSQMVGLTILGKVVGKFAAGNLFAGEYLKTNGTNGEIDFGREYDGSHPSKLRVYVNYRPGTVNSDGKGDKLAEGATDKGQIYVALTTEKVHIDTRYTDPNSSDFALWKTDSPAVLAYGEKIFSSNYGPDGQLEVLDIPIDYKASAKTTKPLYLVIVCTASYYGDYFQGGEGSTMYVDDFELIYE